MEHKLSVFCYWDKGIEKMSPMIRYMYEHNIIMSNKFKFNYILITDDNVSSYINVPAKFNSLAHNFKSDIVRYFALDKYGGLWLDSDIIIIKDLNIIYNNLIESGKLAMLDVEDFDSEIGCASLCMIKNTNLTKMAINNINSLLDSNKKLIWGDLGPLNIIQVYTKYKSDIILNDHNKVVKGCNFISWKEEPGINKQGWIFKNDLDAISKAESLINNPDCFYVITWTIYRINDIKTDIIDFVFKNGKSVFTHLINLIGP
jgi:hypothetical protein